MQRPCSRCLLILLKDHCGWSRQWEMLKSERGEGSGNLGTLVRTLFGGHLLLLDFSWGTLAAFGSPLGWEVRRDKWGGLRETDKA